MSDIKTGGPAFPGGINQTYTDREPGDPTQEGMSLRDYFAAKAMQAMVQSEYAGSPVKSSGEAWAREAYAMADAMLAEREKGG